MQAGFRPPKLSLLPVQWSTWPAASVLPRADGRKLCRLRFGHLCRKGSGFKQKGFSQQILATLVSGVVCRIASLRSIRPISLLLW